MWKNFEDIPGISPETAAKLRQAGINTPRELMALSRSQLLKIIRERLPEAGANILAALQRHLRPGPGGAAVRFNAWIKTLKKRQ